jgi:hypothetical protein
MRVGWQHPVPIFAVLLIIISRRFDFFCGDIFDGPPAGWMPVFPVNIGLAKGKNAWDVF